MPAQIRKQRAFPAARIQPGAGVLAGEQATAVLAAVRQQAEPALRREAQSLAWRRSGPAAQAQDGPVPQPLPFFE